MVAAFKHNDQTSKSDILLFIYIIAYITEFEAVIFLRFLVTAGRVCSMVATVCSNIMIKHKSQTSTCPSISSSESPGSTMSSSSSCWFWIGYCMTETCSVCLCMLVYLPCTHTLSASRNGHTCKPTIPRQNLVLVATASSEWRPRLPSSSSIHPHLVGSGNVGRTCRQHFQLAA